jgi:predicted ArsR family transcriptional regulator
MSNANNSTTNSNANSEGVTMQDFKFYKNSTTGKVYKAMAKHSGYMTIKQLCQKVPGKKKTTLSVALKRLESIGAIKANEYGVYTGKRGRPMKAYRVNEEGLK